jgi:hypothetical protein
MFVQYLPLMLLALISIEQHKQSGHPSRAIISTEVFIYFVFNSSLSLWSMMKKRPTVTVKNAHAGRDQNGNSSPGTNWITAVAALHNTDLVASGGFLCLLLPPLLNILGSLFICHFSI